MIETEMADASKSGGAKVITADEAAALIPDGITISSPIIGLAGWSEEIGRAIAKRYRETGHPKGLTLVCGSAMGNHKDKGPEVMGIEGLIVNGKPKMKLINGLRKGLDMSRVLIELPGPWISSITLSVVEDMKKFLVGEFGPDVSIANVMPSDIMETEALRVGLGVV